MDDVLCLHAEEGEEDFLDEEEEEGEEWPEGGMCCPVSNCPNGNHHFKNLGNYLPHYNRFHQKKIMLYHCPICKVKDAKKSEITRHFKRNHKNKEIGCITGKVVENKKYVNPGDFKKPRKRIHREEREMARLQRMNSVPRKPLFELPENYNARDHRFPHGGYKV